jgi:methyl coenzyme M reductase alpha subunit
MSHVVYRSEVVVERVQGSLRRARVPGESGPVAFGVHGPVAQHYGHAPGSYDPHATTIDYVVAATAG